VTSARLSNILKEHIPIVSAELGDYNTNTENDIVGPKPKAPRNSNDPTYPGPDGKIFIF
jgi:hypothetical protein